MSNTITLLDGRSVQVSNIFFNPDNYHFTLSPTGEDITNKIRRSDKLSNWNNFDPETDNIRLSTGNSNTEPLNESTTSIFVDQITSDPLSAPLETLNNVIDKVIAAPAIKKLAIGAAIGLGIYLIIKISK